ncbi:hypothetical protein RB595_008754 [Gaeumannomyces hyphopodioides]
MGTANRRRNSQTADRTMSTTASNSDFIKAWLYGLRPLSKRGLSFDPRSIPSLAGKVALVTGGASGIGRASVCELARHNPAAVWIADRNRSKAEDVMALVRNEIPAADVRFLELDLGCAKSVVAAATAFLAQSDRLDILMLNAGVLPAAPWATADGYEAMFGVNFVGHARLASLLLQRLLETATIPQADVRLIAVSSGGHSMHPNPDGIRFEAVKDPSCHGMPLFERYGQSKLAVLLWVRRLAHEYPQIKAVSVHPGNVSTSIAADFPHVKQGAPGGQKTWVERLSGTKSPEEGSLNQLWAATAPGVVSGKYYCPVGIPDREFGIAAKRDAADALEGKLWLWLKEALEVGDGGEAKQLEAPAGGETK